MKTVFHDDELGKVAVVTEPIGEGKFDVKTFDVDDNYKLLTSTVKEGDETTFHKDLREQKEHYLEESDKI